MALSKKDQYFINSQVPSEVEKIFDEQNRRLASGERKRAIIPNSDEDFEPLEGLQERIDEVLKSPAAQQAVEICSRND